MLKLLLPLLLSLELDELGDEPLVLPELPLLVSELLEPLMVPLPLLPVVPLPLVPLVEESLEPLVEGDVLLELLEGDALLEPEALEPVPLEEPEDVLSLGSTTVVVVVTVFALESLDGAADGLLDAASLVVVVVVVPWASATLVLPMSDKRMARGNFRIQAPFCLNGLNVYFGGVQIYLDAFFVTGSQLVLTKRQKPHYSMNGKRQYMSQRK